jgi:NAD(P)-dependent dehydrogenase (short-subunit alcohol dehydrogenase family)
MVMLVLLLTACVASLSGGLAVVGHTERRIADAQLRGVQTAYAADAASRLAIDAISRSVASTLWPSDGTIAGLAGGASVMAIAPGETVDLDARTAELNADAAREWPLGPDTPRWRLVGWGRLPSMTSPRRVAVWIAEDVMDADGLPGEDRNGMLMIHVEAFGPRGASRVVAVHVKRDAGAVQTVSWREG